MANRKTIVIDGKTRFVDQPGRRIIIESPDMTDKRMQEAVHLLVIHNRQNEQKALGGNRGVKVGGRKTAVASITDKTAGWFKRWGFVQDVVKQPGWVELTVAGMNFALACVDRIPELSEYTDTPEYCYVPDDHPLQRRPVAASS